MAPPKKKAQPVKDSPQETEQTSTPKEPTAQELETEMLQLNANGYYRIQKLQLMREKNDLLRGIGQVLVKIGELVEKETEKKK